MKRNRQMTYQSEKETDINDKLSYKMTKTYQL